MPLQNLVKLLPLLPFTDPVLIDLVFEAAEAPCPPAGDSAKTGWLRRLGRWVPNFDQPRWRKEMDVDFPDFGRVSEGSTMA